MVMSRSQAGREGAKARHAKSPEEESRIAKKAAETRKANNPNAFREMGAKGGKSSHGGGRKRKDGERE
jgi:general stress protein YciG